MTHGPILVINAFQTLLLKGEAHFALGTLVV